MAGAEGQDAGESFQGDDAGEEIQIGGTIVAKVDTKNTISTSTQQPMTVGQVGYVPV